MKASRQCVLAVSVVLALVGALTGGQLGRAGTALADTAPPPSLTGTATPVTVSADALPTVQINGVVWSQTTVGNTVYAAGSFTSARPAGSPAGTNETPRANLLAYDITTGNLLTSFNHYLNAQALVVSASPDGTTLYVGGDFTTVDGKTHNHLVAFSVSTGALLTGFAPTLDARVRGLAATNSKVYAGGSFTSANGVPRARLAAFTPATGALVTSWAPSADDSNVNALVLTPDTSKLIVGGRFTTLDTQPAYGLGALDAVTGALLPWAANKSVLDAGANAGIYSLRTDGKQVYGSGFVFGAGGNLEGVFAADPTTGHVNWLEDCHGDTYDTFTTGSVLYDVSHSHYCGNIGSFPQTTPWTFYRSTAFTTYPTGTIRHDPYGYHDWYGSPSPTQLDWYPTIDTGTYTGQNQGAWSATGNSNYLALGGEFPHVNGASQQGLVRFAIKSLAPNKAGPRPSTGLTPRVSSLVSGTARVSWTTTFDQDNEALTYKLVRDGQVATPIYTTTINSTFYQPSAAGFTDTGLVPGSTHVYRVYVSDPLGNINSGSSVSVVATGGAVGTYATDVAADGATRYWRLGETSGTYGIDRAGYNDLSEGAGVGKPAPGALLNDANGAATFIGNDTGRAATVGMVDAPHTYSLEAWVKTTSISGGKILGFGNVATGNSTIYDRHLYMDNAGHVLFGVYLSGKHAVSSLLAYNDGLWHHVVATQSSLGMLLYVDGKSVAQDSATTGNNSTRGFWRVGGDNLTGWPARPTSNSLAGSIDEVAVYPTALTVTQLQKHYIDSGRTLK